MRWSPGGWNSLGRAGWQEQGIERAGANAAETRGRAEDHFGYGAEGAIEALEAAFAPKVRLPEHGIHAFEEYMTLVLLLVFGIPCVSCTLMTTQSSVAYWIGNSGFYTSACCFLWILLGHHVFFSSARRFVVIQLLVLPGIAFVLVAHSHRLVALDVEEQLVVQDCVAFPGKHRLERAWNEANAILEACVDNQIRITGSPRHEVERNSVVQRCPGYAEGSKEWGRDWDYLQALETEERCSGWCEYRRALWHSNTESVVFSQNKCSTVVSRQLRRQVRRVSGQIMVYTMGVLVVLGFVLGAIEF
mmetsp:Transcript_43353/g.119946  ORF Transcript_43353/g.119946 Transcript_43353/m.119946 type:complete len:303 (-) Transcript_43353:112-1020(-)|eukprot:CAMPEP_0117620822 /NCGR_PEP_ID=MMETSP0784-20121206/87324_1 /TAXON_ID=39447 /ORGANISM="" /LENGTH=302 /DNA_ID=CAMNT_0005424743 /DNA_START=128 /DNA_END=1036 /DNA_ORIENTATION=-